MKTLRLAVLFASCAWLGACAPNDMLEVEGSPAPHFGEAQRHNLAVQVVNPNAGRRDEPLEMSGQRAALAQGRYVSGKVIQPDTVKVGEVGSTESGGSNAAQ